MLKYKLENPILFPAIHKYLQAHPKLSRYLFPKLKLRKKIPYRSISDEGSTDNTSIDSYYDGGDSINYNNNNDNEEASIDSNNNSSMNNVSDDDNDSMNWHE